MGRNVARDSGNGANLLSANVAAYQQIIVNKTNPGVCALEQTRQWLRDSYLAPSRGNCPRISRTLERPH
jgi:hypothetical protein